MIEAARAPAAARGADIDFEVARAEHLPFPPARLDLVVAVTVLCFVGGAAPVFREMARVLRPGGRLVIGEVGKRSSWAVQRRICGWRGSRLWRTARFRTAPDLCAVAEEAGLTIEGVHGAIYYPRCGFAARPMAPLEAKLSRTTTVGAAFLALSAVKPARP